MKVKVRNGSDNEVFCCSVRKAKETFKGTDVYLDFGYLCKHFVGFAIEVLNNYVKKNIKGRVVCKMSVIDRKPEQILSFYFINADQFSADLRDEFENRYLPEFLRMYREHIENVSLMSNNKTMLVELLNGKLILHEKKL